MGLASELAAAISSEPLIDCDGWPNPPARECLGRILPGFALVMGHSTYCTPCGVVAAAKVLARWGDPTFRPNATDIREAQDARYLLTVALTRIDARLQMWAVDRG